MQEKTTNQTGAQQAAPVLSDVVGEHALRRTPRLYCQVAYNVRNTHLLTSAPNSPTFVHFAGPHVWGTPRYNLNAFQEWIATKEGIVCVDLEASQLVAGGAISSEVRMLLLAARRAKPTLRLGHYGTPCDTYWADPRYPWHARNVEQVARWDQDREDFGIYGLVDVCFIPAWSYRGVSVIDSETPDPLGPVSGGAAVVSGSAVGDTAPPVATALYRAYVERQVYKAVASNKPFIFVTGVREDGFDAVRGVHPNRLLSMAEFESMMEILTEVGTRVSRDLFEGVCLFIANADPTPDGRERAEDGEVVAPYFEAARRVLEAAR